jgi:hypothetical protein
MTLPEDALAKLRQPHLVVHVGDIWWVPEAHVVYRGGKDRFCLVAGLEFAPGAKVPALAHLVPGSRGRGSGPTIVINAGEAGLHQRTYFSFWTSFSLDLATLVAVGKHRGRLGPRLGEVSLAIQASRLVVLKRLSS